MTRIGKVLVGCAIVVAFTGHPVAAQSPADSLINIYQPMKCATLLAATEAQQTIIGHWLDGYITAALRHHPKAELTRPDNGTIATLFIARCMEHPTWHIGDAAESVATVVKAMAGDRLRQALRQATPPPPQDRNGTSTGFDSDHLLNR